MSKKAKFDNSSSLPKLIVLDLDSTVWPFDAAFSLPPFEKRADGIVYDRTGAIVKTYPEVPLVLDKVRSLGIPIAIASRCEIPNKADKLLTVFGLDRFVGCKQIFWSLKKTPHFRRLAEETNVAYQHMILFDDETIIIEQVSRLGVLCVRVENGLSVKLLETGLKMYAEKVK